MAWRGYDALREQDTECLLLVNALVEKLLAHAPMLPPELRVKLDTYHADLANAIEAKGDSRESASVVPGTCAETDSAEVRGNGNEE
jgi:hypothetical protein